MTTFFGSVNKKFDDLEDLLNRASELASELYDDLDNELSARRDVDSPEYDDFEELVSEVRMAKDEIDNTGSTIADKGSEWRAK